MVKAAGSLMDLDERISLTGGLLSASSTERHGIITELVVTQYQVELIKNFYLYIFAQIPFSQHEGPAFFKHIPIIYFRI